MVILFSFSNGLCLFWYILKANQVKRGSQTQIDLFLELFRKTRAQRILFGLRKNTVALQMVPVFYMRALCRASGHCGCVFYSDDLQFIPSIEPNFSTIQMDLYCDNVLFQHCQRTTLGALCKASCTCVAELDLFLLVECKIVDFKLFAKKLGKTVEVVVFQLVCTNPPWWWRRWYF